jgi:uncharacterized protein YndB with AHSA1/START domain
MSTSVGTLAYVEPVIRSVRVAASPARAFEVFSAGMGRWWIPTHSILASKSPQAAVTIEPWVGGRWYERGEDGSECDWGHVLAWEPPRRLVLAWQLDAQWEFDPALVTEVEVRFDAKPGGGTTVTLEHRCLERFGAAAQTVRASVGSDEGWPGLLERYRRLAG